MSVIFDGSSDGLSRTSDILSYNSAFTVAFWAWRTDVFQNYPNLFSIQYFDGGSNSNYDYVGFNSSTTTLIIASNNSTSEINQTGSSLSVETWYHIALVRTAIDGNLLLYLDGSLDATLSSDMTGRPSAVRMEFAAFSTFDYSPFAGRIAYAKAWSGALSAPEIANECGVIRPVRTDSLYGFWPMLSGSPERARDYSGNGRDWTQDGTLTDGEGPPVSWGAPVWVVGQPDSGIAFSLAANGAFTTADADLPVDRSLLLAANGAFTTQDMPLPVDRPLPAASSGSFSTADITLLTDISLSLAATGSFTTADASLLVDKILSLSASGDFVTGDASLLVDRPLSLAANGAFVTNDVTLLTSIELSLNANGAFTTQDMDLSVDRALQMASNGAFVTGEIDLLLGVILSLVANGSFSTGDITLITGASFSLMANGAFNTSDISALIDRPFTVTASGLFVTQDTPLRVDRPLAVAVNGAFSTADITLMTDILLSMVANGSFNTASAALRVDRQMSLSADGVFATNDIGLIIAHPMTLAAEGTFVTSDIWLIVPVPTDDLTVPAGFPITYVFYVMNTGDTYMDSLTIVDGDLSIDQSDMTLLSGTFPIPPGQEAIYYYETVAVDLVNTSDADARPVTAADVDMGAHIPDMTGNDSCTVHTI